MEFSKHFHNFSIHMVEENYLTGGSLMVWRSLWVGDRAGSTPVHLIHLLFSYYPYHLFEKWWWKNLLVAYSCHSSTVEQLTVNEKKEVRFFLAALSLL